MKTNDIPSGYWEDANGALIPVSKIKPIDKDRHETVVALCEKAKAQQATLVGFKLASDQAVQEFIGRSAEEYGMQLRGAKGKGNVTLTSFDGRYKIIRQVQENIVFDERLQVAKTLIDECIKEWGKGSKAEIKVLVNDAFQVDKAGRISVGRVLRLRRLDIADEKWQRAMKAIDDSIQIASTKSYTRFYERDASGEYQAIALDVAAV
jgi:hypothetical protein